MENNLIIIFMVLGYALFRLAEFLVTKSVKKSMEVYSQ